MDIENGKYLRDILDEHVRWGQHFKSANRDILFGNI